MAKVGASSSAGLGDVVAAAPADEVAVDEMVSDPSEAVAASDIVAREEYVRESPRDGTIRGEVVWSDMACPLIEAGVDRRTVVETLRGGDGKPVGKIVHRQAEQIVSSPIACADCGKVLERHQLVANFETGDRSCPQVISARGNPRYKRFFAAVEAGDGAAAAAEAGKFGDMGARLLGVFGVGKTA